MDHVARANKRIGAELSVPLGAIAAVVTAYRCGRCPTADEHKRARGAAHLLSHALASLAREEGVDGR